MSYDIHSDLASASTLPSSAYLDADIYRREQNGLFRSIWWPVGRAERIPKSGEYFTVTIAGEPLILLRDEENQVRAFSRVCRHRAGSVGLDEGGCSKLLRCQYHGWLYDLKGNLQSAPEFEGVKDFNKASTRLPEFRVAQWGGFLFVNLNGKAPPLTSWLAEMVSEVEQAGYDLSCYREVVRRDYILQCNWKVYVDNYLEGYHIPVAHPALMAELDYRSYQVFPRRYHSLQYAPIRNGESENRIYGKDGQVKQTLYYWLFPHFMLNIYPDNMSANYVIPLAPDKTLTIFEWYLRANANGSTPNITAEQAESLAAFSHQVQLEDIVICEAVQRNLASTTYDRGRYCVKREAGVHHFHRLLTEFP